MNTGDQDRCHARTQDWEFQNAFKMEAFEDGAQFQHGYINLCRNIIAHPLSQLIVYV